MRRVVVAIALVLVTLSGGCKEESAQKLPEGSFAGEGTVHRGVGPECPDTWHIATAVGRMLWPVEDTAFQVEGLRVRFTAREKQGAASICMAGTIVDVTHIEKM